jgi:AcrR family transcriptional regulator
MERDVGVGAIPNARSRARALVRADILDEARRQLAREGASGLSLRAVTRQLGMASSAVYRYFPSRDDLLTALIVEAYDALGEVAEGAAAWPGSVAERWRTVCHAIRNWAVVNPHEYALIYGSPVPGYRAPELTTGPASRVSLALCGLLVEAYAGDDRDRSVDDDEQLAAAIQDLTPGMAANARHVVAVALPGVPLPVVGVCLMVWTQLFGMISFELFGQLKGIVDDPEALYDHAVTIGIELLGLNGAGGGYLDEFQGDDV